MPAPKKKGGLALLLGMPDKGTPGKEGDEYAEDEESSAEDYRELAEAAFPDEDWTEDRLSAFKELVMACMGKG